MALTGRFWFRKTWSGKLVLLVEDKRPRWLGPKGSFKLRWRDAKLLDLAEPPLRTLMTLERTYRTEYAPDRHSSAQPASPTPGVPRVHEASKPKAA